MANGRDIREIKRIRNEVLVALKVIYPAALSAERLMRTLLVLFPTLEFEHLKRDLHYLGEKRYIDRVIVDAEDNGGMTPWRRRWFRLTTSGIEIAERCIKDPALEE